MWSFVIGEKRAGGGVTNEGIGPGVTRHGGHRHSFETLGIHYDATRRRFARYQDRFAVGSAD